MMMWLYSIKIDGSRKARLVGRGDMMIPLVDFYPDTVYCGYTSVSYSIKIAMTIAGMSSVEPIQASLYSSRPHRDTNAEQDSSYRP